MENGKYFRINLHLDTTAQQLDPATSKSRHGGVAFVMDYQIIWKNKQSLVSARQENTLKVAINPKQWHQKVFGPFLISWCYFLTES